MNPTLADSISLKAIVDESNKVWYISGNKLPTSSGLPANEFVELPVVRQAARVRTAGTAANLDLLHHLYARKSRGELSSLEICSPLCCASSGDRKDPELMLYQMRSFGVAASLGGWHEFDQRDYPVYALASLLYRSCGVFDDVMRRLLTLCPGWGSLSFVAGLDAFSCAKLFALILDPRWYIDTVDDPNCGAQLERFLGLMPRIQSDTDEAPRDWRHARCQLVLSCWKTKEPGVAELKLPQNFLWRAQKRRGGHMGDLTASKLFVSLLRLNWLSAVANTHFGRLFVPKYFFATESEVKAFNEHCLQRI